MSNWIIENVNREMKSEGEDSDSILSDDSDNESTSNNQIVQTEDVDEELKSIMETVDKEFKNIAEKVGVDVNYDEMPCGSAGSSTETAKKTQNGQTTPIKSQPKAAPISSRRKSLRLSAMERNDVENSKIITHKQNRSRLKQRNALKTKTSKAERKKKKTKTPVAIIENRLDSDRKVESVPVSRKRKISDERAKTILSTSVWKYFTDIQSVAKENDGVVHQMQIQIQIRKKFINPQSVQFVVNENNFREDAFGI